MTTETSHRRKKAKIRFIATKDGVDCGFTSPEELGLANRLQSGFLVATALCGKRGVLVKRPNDPAVFASEQGANRYISIAVRIRDKFRMTMVDEMPKLQPAIEPGVWATRHFVQ